jgi:hypothetical protein
VSADSRSGNARRESSTAGKIVRAAALAAVLVPLGTVAVDATPMNFCGPSASGCSPEDTNAWLFGDFTFTLFFGLEPFANFNVDVTINPYTAVEAAARPLPPGYECIPLDLGYPDPQCWEINVLPDEPQTGNWEFWQGTIKWLNDTNPVFPDPRFFHFFDGTYNDVTVATDDPVGATPPGGNPACYPYCSTFFASIGDPSISGRDDDFSPVIAGGLPQASEVPEPASLVLVGTGIAGYFYRRKKRESR